MKTHAKRKMKKSIVTTMISYGKKAKAMQSGRNDSGGDGKTVGLDKRRSKEGKQADFFGGRGEDAHHVE